VRVLVTGSRDWDNPGRVQLELEKAFSKTAIEHGELLTVVHGACLTGADAYADEWAKRMEWQGLPVIPEPHAANWKGPRKKGAGYARNAEMVSLGADLCLAFILNKSNGATHCRDLALKAGIETITFERTTPMALVPYKRVNDEIKLENVRMIWRNFAGEEKPMNNKGKRNFAIPLDEELALQLRDIGWNIGDNSKKVADGRAEELLYHLSVTVKMDGKRPPKIWMITRSKNRRTPLDEDTVMLLDVAEFELVDVILRPFNWDVQGKQGVAAYLKTLFAVLREDELELKYQDVPVEGAPLELENIIDVEGEWIDDDDDVSNMIALDDIEQRKELNK
jgi:hypothetical protein